MLIAAALLLAAQTAPAPVCTAMDVNLPAPLSGWTMTHAGLMLGHAGTLAARAGGAATDFTIATAGTYGIALDQGGWIDVAPKGGKPLTSVKHGHGPDCSTIKKIVRFDLQPGTYTLTLAKLTAPTAKVMLVKD